MKKLLALLLLAGLSTSNVAFSQTCNATNPRGPTYVKVNVPTRFYVLVTAVTPPNNDAEFFNDYSSYADSGWSWDSGQWQADGPITWNIRGQQNAYTNFAGTSACRKVWVQNAPNISMVSFSTVNMSATVNYSVDSSYSKAARTSTPVVLKYRWVSDFYGTSGTYNTYNLTNMSGQHSMNFTLPSLCRDVYKIYAKIDDGTFTKNIHLGDYYHSNGSNCGIID